MLTALAVLGVVMLLCLVVAFYDRKMVIAISSDPAPTHALRVRRPTPGSEIAQKLAFPIDVVNATLLGAANTTTAAATPNERTRQMLRDTPPKPRHPQPGTAARRHSKDNSTTRRGADPATDTAPEDPSDPGPNPHYIPPFRLIQDDLSGKFDNNRWEVTHIVRNDSLREVRGSICALCTRCRRGRGSKVDVATDMKLASPTQHIQALKEVDGLKNEEVVVVITSTGKKSGVYLRDRIIPSR